MIITTKGNIPQGLFSMESFNHIFGEARNPYDITRTPGGSSGGDGALVRLGLVNAALGSDIGGSLRIPALYNGICTLKPTALRVSQEIITEFFELTEWGKSGPDFLSLLLPTAGPMTRNVHDLELLMKNIVDK